MPTYYHVTPADNLPAILKHGLVPVIGERSALLDEPAEAIYLFTSAEAVEDACGGWLEQCFDEDVELALLAVRLDQELTPNAGVEYETLALHPIPAEALAVLSRDLMGEVDLELLMATGCRPKEAMRSLSI